MSRTIEQLTQEIVNVANENNEKATILFRGLDSSKGELHAELDSMLMSMISMDLDALHNDLESIAAKLYRRRTELRRIEKIISSLPNSLFSGTPKQEIPPNPIQATKDGK
jgi:hypothetical protein